MRFMNVSPEMHRIFSILEQKEFTTMFHDGRVELSSKNKNSFLSPAGEALPDGLDNALAVQALFPVTSATEMAGQTGENPIADLAEDGDFSGIWNTLQERLRAIPEYVALFEDAFPKLKNGSNQLTFADAANAIAAFEAQAFRFDNSPFDEYLRGDNDAMTVDEKIGMSLFYGEAKCASCHSGPFMTDHAIPRYGHAADRTRQKSRSQWSRRFRTWCYHGRRSR